MSKSEKYSIVISVIAIFISLISSMYNFLGFLKGAKIEFFPPEQIILFVYNYGDSKEDYLRLGSRMSYANVGHPSYNAIIKKETVAMWINNKKRVQVWQAFKDWDAEGTKLITNSSKSANPFPVFARSAVSHDTYFAPEPILCRVKNCDSAVNYIKVKEFKDDFEKIRKDNIYSIFKFSYQTEIYGKDPIVAERIALISEKDINILEDNGWIAVKCYDKKTFSDIMANK